MYQNMVLAFNLYNKKTYVKINKGLIREKEIIEE
jgi:hypothetical protein